MKRYVRVLAIGAVLCIVTTSLVLGTRRKPTLSPGQASTDVVEDPERRIKEGSVEVAASGLHLVEDVDFHDTPVVYAVSFAEGRNGDVLLSDNNAHRLIWAAGPAGKTVLSVFAGKDRPQLEWPGRVLSHEDAIYLSDNRGIHVYDQAASETKLVKTFYSVLDFAVGEDGSILAVPLLRNPEVGDPLVIEFNGNGLRRRDFGKADGSPPLRPLLNQGFVAYHDGRLAFAYSHQPRVSVWNRKSPREPVDIALRHNAFRDLQRLDGDTRFTMPRPAIKRLCKYVSGVALGKDRLFVALDLPYVEVLEFTHYGTEVARYIWRGNAPIYRYFGFEVDEERGSFLVGVSFGDHDSTHILKLQRDVI
jgi:hypothetical protein